MNNDHRHILQLTVSDEDYWLLETISRMRGHSMHDLMHIAIELLLEQVERERQEYTR